MSIETSRNEPEEIKNVEEVEGVVEMSPEDFQEMIDQIPALKEMLQEREMQLAELGKDLNTSGQETEAISLEIEELKQEISEREELLGE
ncbi:MAG: hypothetical protein Q7K16_01170 [Candidatus Azambacteria bacterium]|nr:hypothetical protein [Candidatus Azambacteria bacterium]